MGFSHRLHLPLRIRKERIGMLSYHAKRLSHRGHLDRPLIKLSLLILRKATTFKNEPMIVPNVNAIMRLILGIQIFENR